MGENGRAFGKIVLPVSGGCDSAEKHEKPAAPQNRITAGFFSLQSAVGLSKRYEQPAAGEKELYACCPAILEVEHAQHEEQAENGWEPAESPENDEDEEVPDNEEPEGWDGENREAEAPAEDAVPS